MNQVLCELFKSIGVGSSIDNLSLPGNSAKEIKLTDIDVRVNGNIG